MKKIILHAVFLILIGSFAMNAQNIIWTGLAANNNFFDEGNWRNSVTNMAPAAGTIDADVAINLPLVINNVAVAIAANGMINLGPTGSLTIGLAQLSATALSAGNITVNAEGYVNLSSTNPLQGNVQVNLTSGISWVRTPNFSARSASFINGAQIKVNNVTSVYKVNLRLDNYYLNGCVIRPIIATTTPLRIYDGINLLGNSAAITVNTIHSASAISNNMNNASESFVLKKGFMATFAMEDDGTGKSKNYIASEEDLVINTLPKALLNSISFIRVIPWNWVSKKGRNDNVQDIRASWRYKWNNIDESNLFSEYAPMAWGHTGADDQGDIDLYVGKYNSTHIMSFNEPDDCNGQSGQYGNLCQTDVAVAYHKNLMKTGLRIVAPGGKEEAPSGWLREFYNKATVQDIRIDVIAVHWYDWSGHFSQGTNTTAVQIFNRFKSYLTNVHNIYGLPIWITEFNANVNRSEALNNAFMALALPYLETLDYVERYCWFPYRIGNDFYTPQGVGSTVLGPVGITYRDQVSTPAIPEATVNATNNLNLSDYPNVARNKTATANSTYSTFVPSAAVDGNLTNTTSKWVVNFGASDDANFTSLPAWFVVDLQGSFLIDAIRIVEETRALRNFRFEVWDTTLNAGAGGWSSVLNVVNNPATPLTTYKTFTPVTTTRVRLFVTGHNNTDYLRLLELEVYGIPNVVLSNTDFQKNDFSIFPNPVTEGVLNIKGGQKVEKVEVFSILGTKVNITFDDDKVFVDNLPSGVYFIKINNTQSLKFIKK